MALVDTISSREGEWAEPTCRQLTDRDISSISSIHSRAFPRGTLTTFGTRCVEEYYRWHLAGKHAVGTIGLDYENMLVGYCVLLQHNQFFGFLRRALPAILLKLLAQPSLVLDSRFGVRVAGAIGLLMGRGTAKPQENTIRILAIAVDPPFQRKGFAQILLKAAAEIAIKNGANALALSVHPENERARRAYDRDGWERVVVDGEWKGLMRKSLVRDSPKIRPISVL